MVKVATIEKYSGGILVRIQSCSLKNKIMEIGTKYKFSNNKIGVLIKKNNNFGLFKFENGSKYVFNLNKL